MAITREQLSAELNKLLGEEIKAEDFSIPPDEKLGDLALPCFALAKKRGQNPVQVAVEVAKLCETTEFSWSKVLATGPYVNFCFKDEFLKEQLLTKVVANKNFGQGKAKKEKIMVEFAQPNTHKAFHIGHLRNTITGESIVRILENAGHEVLRVNYQGDLGMHIAKALWGLNQLRAEFEIVKKSDLNAKVAFLGQAYARGAQEFESNEAVKAEIESLNQKIYDNDVSIRADYELTRNWSLEYLEIVYARLGVHFDKYYFESQVFKRGAELVKENLATKIFKKSEGAIIFEGEKFGLHSRVFINSRGLTTYEAKDLALAEQQLIEKPDKIIHVVGKEQSEYFKVIFKAIETVWPEAVGKEFHLPYGWVFLKHGKMSSRTGQVVLGEWLIDEIAQQVDEIMKDSDLKDKAGTVEKVSLSAVKYALLKIGVQADLSFDINESVSLAGDSGPYLLYIIARINSLLEKAGQFTSSELGTFALEPSERRLIFSLFEYSDFAKKAAEDLDPSQIAKTLLNLAQDFNSFYANCQIIKADADRKNFRLHLIGAVRQVMLSGLSLLGIESVEAM